MPQSQRSLRLTASYRTRLLATRDRIQTQAERTWPTIEQLDETDWPQRMAAAVTQAQVEAVRVTSAYLSAFLTTETGRRQRVATLDPREFSGKSADGRPLTESLHSPLIGTLGALKEGLGVPESLAIGLNRATRLVGVELDHAHRTALLAAIASDDRFDGWTRVTGGTCAACASKAGVLENGLRFQVHANCKCVSEPVVRLNHPAQATPESYDFTPESSLALRQYQGGLPISYDLRHGLIGPTDKAVSAIDEAMGVTGSLGKPVQAYRGITGDTAQLFGVSSPAELVGKTITDKGYASTSANVATAKTVVRALARKGDHMVWDLDIAEDVRGIYLNHVEQALSSVASQEELMLERGTRWVITAAEKGKDGQWNIKAKVLAPE